MAIAAPSAPGISSSFFRWRSVALTHRAGPLPYLRRTASFHRINSSRSSGAGGFLSPGNGGSEDLDEFGYELQHGVSAGDERRAGLPVFVALPVDAVGTGGVVRRKKAMVQSFRALVAAGVEGVVMEVWWGLVEGAHPGVYDWGGYLELVALASRCGLKVRAVLAFHQCGASPGDPHWIPLPQWVLAEINKDPDLAYSDRSGRRNMEYISIGCDNLPVLRGRSPIQAYADFMKNFRDTFRPFLGAVITGIQVGMGPAGELRYPSVPPQRLGRPLNPSQLGEFQCYDKYMLASLNACARRSGMLEWENGGPVAARNFMDEHENAEIFSNVNGSWNTAYGKFFLEWYSGMLLLHGERICQEAETIFRGTNVSTSGKVAGIHWQYRTESHPSELTAGYYNTSVRDGYLPIARMFARYGFALCSPGFEMRDVAEKLVNPLSSPEGLLRQLLLAARFCEVPMEGENAGSNLDEKSYQQVLKMSKFYCDGLQRCSFSFNFLRMDKNMFDFTNWARFTQFVRQMSEVNIFRVKLALGVGLASTSRAASFRAGFVYC